MAAPKNYSDKKKQDVITEICDKVVESGLSYNQAINESEISRVTFYQWIAADDTLAKLYNYARKIKADILFDEILDIADNTEEGTETVEKPSGTEVKRGDMTQHRRLKIDSRKWVVAKMSPKKYGEKLDIDHTTKGESLNDISKLSTDELIERAKAVKEISDKS